MRHGLFFILAGLLVLAAGVSALADVSVTADAATGLVVSTVPSATPTTDATATPSASATAAFVASPAPIVPPLKARVEKAQERRVQIQANVKERLENAKDRVNDSRENAKERMQDARENAKEKIQNAKEKMQDVRANAKERMLEAREKHRQSVADARALEAQLALKVKALKTKTTFNETEREELAKQTNLHLMAAYHHRIELAKKMQSEGANATLVAEFIAYAEANWNQYANTTNKTARKDLIVQFNQRWRQFKQAVTKDLLLAKLTASVNASRQTLARLDAVIAKLTAGGFNTTALVNASAAISARLDSVLLEPDVPHAIARLRQAHSGLVHLRNAIQRTVNRELVEAYREKPVVSVAADASLSISIDASPTVPAGTAASDTPPTTAAASAAGSLETSANTSVG